MSNRLCEIISLRDGEGFSPGSKSHSSRDRESILSKTEKEFSLRSKMLLSKIEKECSPRSRKNALRDGESILSRIEKAKQASTRNMKQHHQLSEICWGPGQKLTDQPPSREVLIGYENPPTSFLSRRSCIVRVIEAGENHPSSHRVRGCCSLGVISASSSTHVADAWCMQPPGRRHRERKISI